MLGYFFQSAGGATVDRHGAIQVVLVKLLPLTQLDIGNPATAGEQAPLSLLRDIHLLGLLLCVHVRFYQGALLRRFGRPVEAAWGLYIAP